MKRRPLLVSLVVVMVGFAVWQILARASAKTAVPAMSSQAQAAQAPQPTAHLDLSSAPYLARLSAAARSKLERDGLVIVPGGSSIPYFYRECKQDNIPIFVTSDAMLNTSHQLFDWCVRFLELGYLRGDMLNLTDTMLREMMTRGFRDRLFNSPLRGVWAGARACRRSILGPTETRTGR